MTSEPARAARAARPEGAASAASADRRAAALLMSRYCDGDRAAFDALYALLAPRIFDGLMERTQDRQQAEDLLMRTFLRLHESRDLYVRDADPLPWVEELARFTYLESLRGPARRLRLQAGGSVMVRVSGALWRGAGRGS
jgi:RNA polymerase sigma-70 factor (ECF subfamily)